MKELDVFDRYLRRPTRRRLARVVRALHGHVWSVALRVAGNQPDAADICQDVFLSLLLDPPAPGKVRSPKGYLSFRVLTLAERMGRSAERRRKRETEAARRLITDEADAEVDIETIQRAIRRLPDRTRATVELRYLAELSTREVAAALEVSDISKTEQRSGASGSSDRPGADVDGVSTQISEAAGTVVLRGYVVDGRDRRVPGAWVGLFEPESAFASARYSFAGLDRVAREYRLLKVREGSESFERSTRGKSVAREGLNGSSAAFEAP